MSWLGNILTAKGDLLIRTASGWGRLAVGSNDQVVTADSAQTLGVKWAAVASATSLLRAASGTDTNAAATNVDTVAISGLTAKDRLVIMAAVASATQQTASSAIYNATDSVTIINVSAAIAAGTVIGSEMLVQQRQTAATAIVSRGHGYDTAGNRTTDNGAGATFTTAWTGSWTLALRHGGVTAGGTFDWSWIVLKVAGQ